MTFEEVYDRYFPFVWRTLRRLGVSESDASDASQEVFLVVHRRLASFEGRAKITTWLYKIVSRIARDGRNRAHRRYEVMGPVHSEGHHPDTGPDARAEQQQSLALLDRALADLSPQQREVFVLFELEEMTTSEIAHALGIPKGTVQSRLRLAREHFRRAIRRQTSPTTTRDGLKVVAKEQSA